MQCKQASIASPSGIFTCSGPAEERVPVVHEATQIEDGDKKSCVASLIEKEFHGMPLYLSLYYID